MAYIGLIGVYVFQTNTYIFYGTVSYVNIYSYRIHML